MTLALANARTLTVAVVPVANPVHRRLRGGACGRAGPRVRWDCSGHAPADGAKPPRNDQEPWRFFARVEATFHRFLADPGELRPMILPYPRGRGATESEGVA